MFRPPILLKQLYYTMFRFLDLRFGENSVYDDLPQFPLQRHFRLALTVTWEIKSDTLFTDQCYYLPPCHVCPHMSFHADRRYHIGMQQLGATSKQLFTNSEEAKVQTDGNGTTTLWITSGSRRSVLLGGIISSGFLPGIVRLVAVFTGLNSLFALSRFRPKKSEKITAKM